MAGTVATASQTLTAITPEIHKVAPITGFTTIWGITINPMVITLAIIAAIVGTLIYRGVKANHFNPYDLVQDIKADGSRVASGIKITYQAAFVISSWVVIDQEIKGTLNDAIFAGYLATWCASLIAKVVWDKQEPIRIPGSDR